MKYALAFALIAATPAVAQDFGMAGRSYSVDLGIGAAVGPEYPGSDEGEVSPWIIWRNSGFGNSVGGSAQGLSFAPSFGTVGDRDTGDYPELSGLDDIDRAYELGLRVSYGMGPVTAFGSLRRGFDGHEGLTGEIGAKYRTQLTERLTLWSGAELVYGDDEFNNTYFGVTAAESAASGLDETQPGGGLNEAALTFEAKYAMTETTSLLGEIRYGKLIGDAADSPVVQEEYQPSLRLGVTRRFTFGF
ncbi:MipA/OmpV family protein [Paracoccus sp. 1_MG-2023]|uniref:MipA/OmpV family protein n=1 Tax=unclassified Paracoccus (in: a-proteobacteria) TaxID=2688777 RepID=UPI001C09AC3A|nr:MULTISPECIES: MipA/OmpV family protein [unclassified Paracoccus (in: a-proteobacteria)]MBU2958439.1 MipA/OmpV family protein [Paracoccus sp. C2R09]MDO6668576.1 MipA/OmpV family protein [Paracoccus sp. 1_MG-2023]